MTWLRKFWSLVREAVAEWIDDRASEHGAALAFYSLLSLAPLLVLALAVAAFFFDEHYAREQLAARLESIMGSDGAGFVRDTLTNAQQPQLGTVASLLSFITLLLGASGVFGQLQTSLNEMWDVPPKANWSLKDYLKDRILSFLMILVIGVLLLGSLILSGWIAIAGEQASAWGFKYEPLWHAVNSAVSIAVVTILFAMIFKFLPDAKIEWRDVWFGAIITSLLFNVGKFFIAIYLGKSGIATTYGAAGSLVVLVVWVYYSAQILYFGAELTQVYARRHGSRSDEKTRQETRPPTPLPSPNDSAI